MSRLLLIIAPVLDLLLTKGRTVPGNAVTETLGQTGPVLELMHEVGVGR